MLGFTLVIRGILHALRPFWLGFGLSKSSRGLSAVKKQLWVFCCEKAIKLFGKLAVQCSCGRGVKCLEYP